MNTLHYLCLRWPITVWAGLFVLSVARLSASDFEGADFSLRFPAAITRFASYGDVAGFGGAQAALEWSSSTNPASAAWPHPDQKTTVALSPQFTSLRFDQGTELRIFSEALTLDAGERGVFLPSVAQIRSNHEVDRNGLGFHFDADYFQLQWGKALAKDLTVGINVNLTTSETVSDFSGFTVGRSRGESYDFRLGVVQRVWSALRVGAVLDYTFAPSRADLQVFDPASLGFVAVRSEDTARQFLLRTGIAWEYAKGSTLLIDYQGGVFRNQTGNLRVHRFPIGIEQMAIKDILFVRAGTTLDTRGHAAVTAGVGVYPSRHCSVDVGYQHDMFPEIHQEFGSSEGWVSSVSVAF